MALTTLEGFSRLDSVGEGVIIVKNPMLVNLNGLNGLKRVERSLEIREKSNLKSLMGLESLQFVGKTLDVSYNPNLKNLDGLNQLRDIKGDDALINVTISGNGSLPYCRICDFNHSNYHQTRLLGF